MDTPEEYFQTLKEHVKRIPCFTCVVRTPCSTIVNGHISVKENTCVKWVHWIGGRDAIVQGTADKIIKLVIAEVREGEKSAREDNRN